MKNKLKPKKIALLILVILLLLILLSNYLKSSETNLTSILLPTETEKELSPLREDKDEIKYKDQAKIGNNNRNKNLKTDNTALKRNKSLSKDQSENKKVIQPKLKTDKKAIKDPFKTKRALNKSEENEDPKGNIFLEEDLKLETDLTGNGLIIGKERDLKPAKKFYQNESEKNEKEKDEAELKIEKSFLEEEKKKKMRNFRPPFELLGIIKDQKNSAVILLYQDQKIIKKEKEMIDVFLIEEIKNKSLIISYKNEKKKMQLWGVQNED